MKVIILENNIKNDTVIKNGIFKAVELCKNIGFQLDVAYKTTNVSLTPVPISTDVVKNGFMIDPKAILDSVSGSEDVACMIYDWSLVPPFDYGTSKPINPSTSLQKKGNTVPVQIPEQWYGGYDWVLTQFFLHELCHALYFLTRTPNDLTHFQYQNPSYSQRTPTDYYLFLISTMNKTTIPTVNIKRGLSDGKQTMGDLTTLDGQFGCKTLERSWLNNKQNVSCIPTGTYNVQWTFSFRFLKYTYELQNVPSRSGIRIHSGNYFFDSAGCIILGSLPQDINKDGELDLINSRVILSAFESKMGKKPFNLVIQ